VRSEHFHRGDLLAGELDELLIADPFHDPSFRNMLDLLGMDTRVCLIEWLRQKGEYKVAACPYQTTLRLACADTQDHTTGSKATERPLSAVRADRPFLGALREAESPDRLCANRFPQLCCSTNLAARRFWPAIERPFLRAADGACSLCLTATGVE